MKRIFKFFVQYYLKFLTKFVLLIHRPLIIAVAGVTNKTTIKEYILKFLREKYPASKIRGNPRSYNTEIGLPLAVLFLESGESSFFQWIFVVLRAFWKTFFVWKFPKILVLELGVDQKGDMGYLLSIVSPKIAVITTIESNYLDGGFDLDELTKEFQSLVSALPPEGTLILNADDERVSNLSKHAKAKVIRYGFSSAADARITDLRSDAYGQSFSFSYNSVSEKVRIKKYGKHQVYAWMIAKITKNLIP